MCTLCRARRPRRESANPGYRLSRRHCATPSLLRPANASANCRSPKQVWLRSLSLFPACAATALSYSSQGCLSGRRAEPEPLAWGYLIEAIASAVAFLLSADWISFRKEEADSRQGAPGQVIS